jgi:hypothetical protein
MAVQLATQHFPTLLRALEAKEAECVKYREALEDVIAAWVNPADGGPFEDGEVPALDACRSILSTKEKTE